MKKYIMNLCTQHLEKEIFINMENLIVKEQNE